MKNIFVALKNLTEKQKKIINIVITCLQIVIVILAITASAVVLANPRTETVTVSKGPVKLLPVLTNSMAGNEKTSFKAGDLIVAKNPPKNLDKLNVGDIVVFKWDILGEIRLNTHRIIEKTYDSGGNIYFKTRGDAAAEDDTQFFAAENVLAVYDYKLVGTGKTVQWLQKPTNFFCLIILPLILLFLYNVYLVVRMLMHAKISKVQSEAAIDEEAIKKKAIEEYLAKQKEEEEKGKGTDN